MTLDELITAPQWSSRHVRLVDARPARVWEAIHTTAIDDHPVVRLLTAVRAAPRRLRGPRTITVPSAPRTLLELVPYPIVAVIPGRYVAMAGVGKPWQLTRTGPPRRLDARSIASFDEPGWVKLAMDITIVAHGDGSRVETETRVQATDDIARRAFGRYWWLIARPSGLLRRTMLHTIATAAQQPR